MSCREKKNLVRTMAPPLVETITATGPGTDDLMTGFITNAGDFNTFTVYLMLPTGTAAAPGNLPTALKVYGIKDTGSPTVNCLIVDKCFENADGDSPTGWNGVVVLELDETDLGAALGSGDCTDFEALRVAIEGVAAQDYVVVAQAHKAEFSSEDHIGEEFTYA